MEYPDGCSTAMRCVARKVGLYGLEMVSLQGCYFWTDGLTHDSTSNCEGEILVGMTHHPS